MRVLIAARDSRTGNSLRRAVEVDGHTTFVVADEHTCRIQCVAGAVDVVLLDADLPPLGAPNLCRALLASEFVTAVIVFAARPTTEECVAVFEAGGSDYLAKPVHPDELRARIRARDRRQAMIASPLRCADLSLDVRRHQAIRDGQAISLTMTEFRLLHLLLRQTGKVVTREVLRQELWTDDSSNMPDVYVHYLRNKIDRGFARPLLHTVSGVGYVLRDNPEATQ